MSESVTGGLPFGDIPADTEMFTAEQTVSKIASLQTILSGITEEGWSGLDNIISGIDSVTATFATKAELSGLSGVVDDRIAPISGDLLLACGVDSGVGVYRVCYWKNKRDGTSESVQLLDEAMFQMCGLCGNDVVDIVNEANRFLQYVSPTYGDRDGVAAGSRVLDPYYAVSGLGLANGSGGLTDRGTALSGFINKLTSGGGGGGSGGESGGGGGGSEPAFIPPNFWPNGDPQSGETFCNLVSGCIGDEYVKSGELCELVSGCVSSYENWGQIAQAITQLTATVCGLSFSLSGLVNDLSDSLVDSIMDMACSRVISNPDSTKEQKDRAAAIKGVLDDEDKRPRAIRNAIDNGKKAIKQDLPDVKDDLDAINNALDNDHQTPAGEQPDDLSEALDPDGSGTDASAEVQPSIDEATETIANETGSVVQLWGDL